MTQTDPDSSSATRRTGYVERLAQVVLSLIALAILWKVTELVAPVLAPVLVSLLLAYFLDPMIDWFEAKGINRTLAIIAVATIVLLVLIDIGLVVVPMLAIEIRHAVAELPAYVSDQYAALQTLLADRFGVDLEAELTDSGSLQAVAERMQQTVGRLAASVFDSAASLLNLVLIPVFTFYFLRDFDTLKKQPLALIPRRYHDNVVKSATEMDTVVGQWMRGQVQVALILAVLYAIGLGVAGVKLGVFIGVVAGLLNIVPYFGAFIGIALSVLMAVIYGDGVSELIGVAIVFAVVQSLEGYVITPRLVGEKVGMSPSP